MAEEPNDPIAVIGIDIGKNPFHVVGVMTARDRAAAEVVAWSGRGAVRQYAAEPDRHSCLPRRTSS